MYHAILKIINSSRDSLDLLFATYDRYGGVGHPSLYIPRLPRHALLDPRLALTILLCSAILN